MAVVASAHRHRQPEKERERRLGVDPPPFPVSHAYFSGLVVIATTAAKRQHKQDARSDIMHFCLCSASARDRLKEGCKGAKQRGLRSHPCKGGAKRHNKYIFYLFASAG